MQSTNSLTAVATRYLQAVETLSQTQSVRQIDVAKHLKVGPSTCFESIIRLIGKGLLFEDENKCLTLSAKGAQTLAPIKQNQFIFATFFRDVLGQCCEEANQTAAHIEPLLNLETALEMCRFNNFLHHIKGQPVDFWQAWQDFQLNPESDEPCLNCAHNAHCLKKRQASL